MSTYSAGSEGAGHDSAGRGRNLARRLSTETKASYKTTELLAYIAAVIAVLVASAVSDNEGPGGFGANEAWRYVTYLTIGYMVSRGLAKAGSRDSYDDNDNR